MLSGHAVGFEATQTASADPPDSNAPLTTPGAAVGRYLVIQKVGAGGMGVVLRAYDPKLRREVALKLVLTRSLGDEAEARLEREAQALAQLSHPNVVPVYDVDRSEGRIFIAMEFVEGHTLGDWLQVRKRRWREIVAVFLQAGRGVAAAHAAGLVHRDFKPANVMIDRTGRVRVMDFGLALAVHDPTRDDEDSQEQPTATSSDDSRDLAGRLTRDGHVMGTPSFMAPEQHRGTAPDARSDQFAFCVALFQALYGKRPFEATGADRLCHAKEAGNIAQRGDSRVPRWLDRIVVRGMAGRPDDRFASMDALLDELAKDPGVARRRAAIGALALASIGAAVATTQALARAPAPCENAGQEIERSWNDARRDSLRSTFEAVQRPFAAHAFDRASSRLEIWSQGWRDQSIAACEATRVRQTQSEELLDLRSACLATRLTEFDAVVEVLDGANAAVIERAPRMVQQLAPPSRCADTEALLAIVPPPDDPAVAGRVAEARRLVAEAKALGLAGEYEKGVDAARKAVEVGSATGYAPIEAATGAALGRLLGRTGDFEGAAQTLDEAYFHALRGADDRTAAETAAELSYVLSEHRAQFEQAAQWERHALAIVGRGHVDVSTRIGLLMDLGRSRIAQSKLDAALQYFEQAQALVEAHEPDVPSRVASIESALAIVYSGKGEFDAALAHNARALEAYEEFLGPGHPTLAEPINNMAWIHAKRAEFDQAVALYTRSYEIRRRALPSGHPDVAISLYNLASARQDQGDSRSALPQLQQSVDAFARVFGPQHPHVGGAMTNLARAYHDVGEPDRAIEKYTEARTILERALGPSHPHIGACHLGIARALTELRRYDEALAAATRGFEVVRTSLGEGHVDTARAIEHIAVVHEEAGRPAKALEYYAQMVKILRDSVPGTSSLLAKAEDGLARTGGAGESRD